MTTFVLKLAAALVTILVVDLLRAFCQHHGLNYTEASSFGADAQAVRHLHAVGASLRLPVSQPRPPEPGEQQPSDVPATTTHR